MHIESQEKSGKIGGKEHVHVHNRFNIDHRLVDVK